MTPSRPSNAVRLGRLVHDVPAGSVAASPAALSAYPSMLAGAGAKIATMSRRIPAIDYADRARNLPN